AAEIMDVGADRQVRRLDLYDRPYDDDRPFRMRVGDRGEQVEVHAFVDDAEEAEPRAVDRRLIVGHGVHAARLREVSPVDARRERVNVRMAILLGLVEAVAAGE